MKIRVVTKLLPVPDIAEEAAQYLRQKHIPLPEGDPNALAAQYHLPPKLDTMSPVQLSQMMSRIGSQRAYLLAELATHETRLVVLQQELRVLRASRARADEKKWQVEAELLRNPTVQAKWNAFTRMEGVVRLIKAVGDGLEIKMNVLSRELTRRGIEASLR